MISRKILVVALLLISIVGVAYFSTILNSKSFEVSINNIDKTSYEINEEKVVVINTDTKEETTIDLSAKEEGFTVQFIPHDIEIAPDKKSVWVSAAASQDELNTLRKALEQKSEGDQHIMMATDQIIVINTQTNTVIKRIEVGVGLQLAEIVLTPDSKYLYIAAELGNAIYKVNTSTYKVDLIQLPPESKPHQLALATDGTILYARNSANSNTFFISTKTNEIKKQDDVETRNLNWSTH